MRILFKFIGAVMITAAGALVALKKNARLSQKSAALEKTVLLLQKLKNLIEYKKMPAVAALMTAVNEIGFTAINTDWYAVNCDYGEFVNKNFGEKALGSMLSEEAAKKLNEALLRLGESTVNEEKSKLEYYILWFKEKLCAAKEYEKNTAKVYRALGLYGGLAAAVLLF